MDRVGYGEGLIVVEVGWLILSTTSVVRGWNGVDRGKLAKLCAFGKKEIHLQINCGRKPTIR